MKTKFVPKGEVVRPILFADLEVGQGFRIHSHSDVFIKIKGEEANTVDVCSWQGHFVADRVSVLPVELELKEL